MNGIDPLIKLAALHYQFEAIHPFVDGNGRTGRIINILFLVEKGLLDTPILFLSHYILRTKPTYYAGLRGVTEQGAWIDWVMYMLEAIETTALETQQRVAGCNLPANPGGNRPITQHQNGTRTILYQRGIDQGFIKITC